MNGDNANDNCQLEFNYALTRKSKSKMLAVAHISAVLGSVRDSITATQQRCTDSAVNTDLLILQHVVQSKLA